MKPLIVEGNLVTDDLFEDQKQCEVVEVMAEVAEDDVESKKEIFNIDLYSCLVITLVMKLLVWPCCYCYYF